MEKRSATAAAAARMFGGPAKCSYGAAVELQAAQGSAAMEQCDVLGTDAAQLYHSSSTGGGAAAAANESSRGSFMASFGPSWLAQRGSNLVSARLVHLSWTSPAAVAVAGLAAAFKHNLSWHCRFGRARGGQHHIPAIQQPAALGGMGGVRAAGELLVGHSCITADPSMHLRWLETHWARRPSVARMRPAVAACAHHMLQLFLFLALCSAGEG
jgi:hypothetical protein